MSFAKRGFLFIIINIRSEDGNELELLINGRIAKILDQKVLALSRSKEIDKIPSEFESHFTY
jgi:hypothetical protein